MTRNAFLLIMAVFFVSASADAQIVNMERARMQSDTTGWKGNAGAAVSLTKNDIQVFSADADAHLQYKSKRSLYLLLGSYGFLKGAGRNLIDNAFLHLRYNYKVSAMVRWEIFTQLQRNRITGIRSRYLLGSGPRFKLLDKKAIRLYTGTLMMYERETGTNPSVAVENNVRISSYASFTIIPSKEIEIISTTYFQPILDNWNDHRLLNQLTLRVKAGKGLGFRLNWDYMNDSRPVAGIPSVIYKLSTGLDYDF